MKKYTMLEIDQIKQNALIASEKNEWWINDFKSETRIKQGKTQWKHIKVLYKYKLWNNLIVWSVSYLYKDLEENFNIKVTNNHRGDNQLCESIPLYFDDENKALHYYNSI